MMVSRYKKQNSRNRTKDGGKNKLEGSEHARASERDTTWDVVEETPDMVTYCKEKSYIYTYAAAHTQREFIHNKMVVRAE